MERKLNTSTEQVYHLETENELERQNVIYLEQNFQSTLEILTDLRRRNARKNLMCNRLTKKALRAKRIAVCKLQEALKRQEMEMKRSSELECYISVLESTVQQLKFELEQKERSFNETKRRLVIHGELASLAYRKIHEANSKIASLLNNNEKLHAKCISTRSELINTIENQNKMKAEMTQIKMENEKHYEEMEKLKQIIETEMTSLIGITEQNRTLLVQKGNAINLLTYENFEIKKRTEKLEQVKKNMEESIRNTEAVLRAQHQELQVYEANQKIRERDNGEVKSQHDQTTNRSVLLEQEANQFQQVVQCSIYRIFEFRNEIAHMLNNADVSNLTYPFFLSISSLFYKTFKKAGDGKFPSTTPELASYVL